MCVPGVVGCIGFSVAMLNAVLVTVNLASGSDGGGAAGAATAEPMRKKGKSKGKRTGHHVREAAESARRRCNMTTEEREWARIVWYRRSVFVDELLAAANAARASRSAKESSRARGWGVRTRLGWATHP